MFGCHRSVSLTASFAQFVLIYLQLRPNTPCGCFAESIGEVYRSVGSNLFIQPHGTNSPPLHPPEHSTPKCLASCQSPIHVLRVCVSHGSLIDLFSSILSSVVHAIMPSVIPTSVVHRRTLAYTLLETLRISSIRGQASADRGKW
jgi:hypothetical protein